jgi:hypothetical protein
MIDHYYIFLDSLEESYFIQQILFDKGYSWFLTEYFDNLTTKEGYREIYNCYLVLFDDNDGKTLKWCNIEYFFNNKIQQRYDLKPLSENKEIIRLIRKLKLERINDKR